VIPRNYLLPDPKLSEPGLEQCKELQRHLKGEKLKFDFENIQPRVKELLETTDLIVTSPLMRTCQTTVGGLGFLIDKGIKVVVDARIQGMHLSPSITNNDW
jgi:broad specificity phosphatase PhoE